MFIRVFVSLFFVFRCRASGGAHRRQTSRARSPPVIRSDVGPPTQQVYRPTIQLTVGNHAAAALRCVSNIHTSRTTNGNSQKASALEMHVFLQKENGRVMVMRKSRPSWCAPRFRANASVGVPRGCRVVAAIWRCYLCIDTGLRRDTIGSIGETRQTQYSVSLCRGTPPVT